MTVRSKAGARASLVPAGPSNWVQHTARCCSQVWRPFGWKCLPGPSDETRAATTQGS